MVFPLATVAIGSTTFMVIMWFFSACGADVRQAERRSLAEAFAGQGLAADVRPALKIARSG